MKHFTKDPDAVLDYTWDWTSWLADGETIDTSDVAIASGTVTLDSDANDDTKAIAWISGGTVGRSIVTCRITTSAARTDDRSIILDVRER